MKAKILPVVIWTVFTICVLSSYGQANKTLSNLTSPTAVNVSLLPGTNNAINLGSSTKQWKYLFLHDRIYLNGNLTMHAHGTNNIFVGALAGNTFNTAMQNTGVGGFSLFSLSSGYGNTATGYRSLLNNTTGGSNVANGLDALRSNTGGNGNTAIGSDALYSNINGYSNTAIGSFSLYTSIGTDNTAVGDYTGSHDTSGSYNTFIGSHADCGPLGTIANSTAIGYGASVNTDNTVRLGNSAVKSIGGFADWTNISDGRVKKNIKQNVPGLAFINQLQPVTYNLDLDAADRITFFLTEKDKNGKIIQPDAEEIASRKEKEGIVYTGFVAQDVEKAAKALNYDFSGVDAAKNEHDLYGLRYAEFVVPLVKAVQELSQKNNDLEKTNIELIKQNNDLEQRVSRLEATMNIQAPIHTYKRQAANLSSASLRQNIPNPFINLTTVFYHLPPQFSSAKITVTDINGQVLKELNISPNTENIKIDASALAQGTYQYSLIVDGRVISTRQMIVTH